MEKTGASQCGGGFAADVRALAVPFSLVLAKFGLSSLKKKNAGAKKPSQPKAKAPQSKQKSPSKKSKTQRGGGCGCAGTPPPMMGGAQTMTALTSSANQIIHGVNELVGGARRRIAETQKKASSKAAPKKTKAKTTRSKKVVRKTYRSRA